MREYVVIAGDTLSHIAQRELGDALKWKVVYKANEARIKAEQRKRGARVGSWRANKPMTPPWDWIFPGQTLIIPGR